MSSYPTHAFDYPTLTERLSIAHSGGRNRNHPGFRFPPPDEPRAITVALQAIYESARGNANGARNYAKLAVRLTHYANKVGTVQTNVGGWDTFCTLCGQAYDGQNDPHRQFCPNT